MKCSSYGPRASTDIDGVTSLLATCLTLEFQFWFLIEAELVGMITGMIFSDFAPCGGTLEVEDEVTSRFGTTVSEGSQGGAIKLFPTDITSIISGISDESEWMLCMQGVMVHLNG